MLAVNVFLVCEGRRHIEWRSVRGLLLGGLPGVPIGALALKHLPDRVIGVAISVVTLLFGILFLVARPHPVPRSSGRPSRRSAC